MASSNEYMATYMLRRYHERRTEAIEILGGCCAACGATESLEIDHRDPKQKTLDIGKLWSVSRKRYLEELEKCQLLCRTHHIEKSVVERGQSLARGTHGTLAAYRYCKCEECREANRKASRAYRQKRRARNQALGTLG